MGAEIGVDEGAYSAVLCQAIPGLKLHCIDSWELNTGAMRRIRLRSFEQAKTILTPYDVTLIKKESMDALGDFEDRTLDFVYIDAGHRFDDVMNDIMSWTKKVRKGGVVAGHDYVSTAGGVVAAIDAYTKGHHFKLQVTTDPSEPISWWFTKKWNT